MTGSAAHLKKCWTDAAAVPGKKSRIWHALYIYRTGTVETNKTPDQLHPSAGATYADNVFETAGNPFTPVPHKNDED
jgi:hypothetical protein